MNTYIKELLTMDRKTLVFILLLVLANPTEGSSHRVEEDSSEIFSTLVKDAVNNAMENKVVQYERLLGKFEHDVMGNIDKLDKQLNNSVTTILTAVQNAAEEVVMETGVNIEELGRKIDTALLNVTMAKEDGATNVKPKDNPYPRQWIQETSEILAGDTKEVQCTGSIINESGTLTFLPSNNITRRCIWTIQAGSFEHIRVTMEQENFNVSNMRLRITAMWTFREYNITNWSQHFWYLRKDLQLTESKNFVFRGAGSQGRIQTYPGPVIFVEMLPVNEENGRDIPNFQLRFRGTGNRTAYSNKKFSHNFLTQQSGSLERKTYENDEVFSVVILPQLAGGKVFLSEMQVDLDDGSCLYDFVQVIKIGLNNRWGTANKYYRNCGSANSVATDDVGFILMFFSDESRISGGFAYSYDAE